MAVRDAAAELLHRIHRRAPSVLGASFVHGGITPYASSSRGFSSTDDSCRMRQLFALHDGPLVHKWDHYLEVYDRHLSPFVGSAARALEIGVSHGGSLRLLRSFLGERATVFGIDVDGRCERAATPTTAVRIGDQSDQSFLRSVVAEMGGLDVVIDDGSHVARDQQKSFEILFPLLSEGGVYITEDLHTAYWPGRYRGGYRRKGTFIELAKSMIDHMHRWYHRRPGTPLFDCVGALHFYDSIVVIDKKAPKRPMHSQAGRHSF